MFQLPAKSTPTAARGLPRKRFADGGMVRGLGSGTSDEVPGELRPGSFVMPADSTRQIGPRQLGQLGGQLGAARGLPGFGAPQQPQPTVPVQLSNGEYALEPEQVHAVGAQALEAMRQQTHAPHESAPARGLPGMRQSQEPRMFFADGGLVPDWEKRRGTPPNIPPNSLYGQSNPPGPGAHSQSDPIAGPQAARGLLTPPASSAPAAAPSAAPSAAPQTASMEPQDLPPPPAKTGRTPMPDYWTPGQPWDARMNGSEQQRIYTAAHNPGSHGGPRGLVLPQNPLGLDPAARSNRLAQERLAAQIAAPIAGARGLTAAQRNQLVALSGQQQNALHNEQNALHNAAALAGQQHIAAQNNAAALAQTGMREAGQNARAAQALELERATKMPAALAARRMEALHQRYEESQNPQDREAIARQIRHLSGQAESNPRDEWITVGGGQEFDEAAGIMRNVPQRLFNVRTRQFLDQPSGAQENTGASQAPPPDGTVLAKDGKKYVMRGGAAVSLDGPT